MKNIVSQATIISNLQTAKNTFVTFCDLIDEKDFFLQPPQKWSIAQHIHHLTVSTRLTLLAYRLPKFVVKLYGGKPNRPSHDYNTLVEKYKQKLLAGGKASGVFIPKPIPTTNTKQKTVAAFHKKMDALILTIQKKWHDEELDQYIIPHPLLGKITLRELGFFTIYHTYHHLEIIKQRL
jgi:hypothetical protein